MNFEQVKLPSGQSIKVPSGTTVGSLIPAADTPNGIPFIAATVNNDVSSLSYPITVNSTVRFLTIEDSHGWRVYRRSLCFLLAKAVKDCYPKAIFRVEHSFGAGLYCTFQESSHRKPGISRQTLKRLSDYMEKLVKASHPIERHKISYSDAVRGFKRAGQEDKLSLLRHRNPPRVVIHQCDGFSDLAHGPLVQHTGVLNKFRLIPYEPGFVLHLPERSDPNRLPRFQNQPNLFHIFQEHKGWGRILGVSTVGRLNEIISRGELNDFIRINEALHEKKTARIADQIAGQKGGVKVVLIAGPSCSGKTTFGKRLDIQLRANGIRPVMLSTDDYFVGPARNPKDASGKPDFEHLEAVDINFFNRQMDQLIAGKTVELPRYDFTKKQRIFRGETLQIKSDEIIIVEGIHGLNPRLSAGIPARHKFKIYVSALTQLSVDSNNRISTTDNRLMRRIIRDHLFRGHSAMYTLQLWPGVRNGEKTWIFPYQEEADATFNSALDYELAVLKPYVEPLLMDVKPDHEEYAEARRLSEFLLNFLSASPMAVPRTSILREYIGGSAFKY